MADTFVLPAKLDLPAASELADALKKARGADLGIDASAVTHIGTNCLQVLIAASKTWAADGKGLTFAPLSDAFTEQLDQFGLPLETLTEGASTK